MVLMRQLRGWSEHEFISLCLHRVLSWMTDILYDKTFLCYFCWNGVFPEQIRSSVFQPKPLLLGTIFQGTKRFLQPVVVFSLPLKNLPNLIWLWLCFSPSIICFVKAEMFKTRMCLQLKNSGLDRMLQHWKSYPQSLCTLGKYPLERGLFAG